MTGSGPFVVTSADFNNDGKFDIAVVNYNDNTIGIFLNFCT
jgi:hypothetical protein